MSSHISDLKTVSMSALPCTAYTRNCLSPCMRSKMLYSGLEMPMKALPGPLLFQASMLYIVPFMYCNSGLSIQPVSDSLHSQTLTGIHLDRMDLHSLHFNFPLLCEWEWIGILAVR